MSPTGVEVFNGSDRSKGVWLSESLARRTKRMQTRKPWNKGQLLIDKIARKDPPIYLWSG